MFALFSFISALFAAILSEKGGNLWLEYPTWIAISIAFLALHFLIGWAPWSK